MAERTTDKSYDIDQVGAVLEHLGLDVVAKTHSDYLCFCPFHPNTDTPSFAVGSENGLYICFNAACDAVSGGSLVSLVMKLSDRNHMEAMRMIAKKGAETARPLSARLTITEAEERWPIVPQMKIDELVDNLWKTPRALDYVKDSRGFVDSTLRHFEVGYEPEKDMVVVPIHDKDGNPIGVNGRSIEGKFFKLTKRLPRNKVLFNMHRVLRTGGTAIICESQFDVMRLHQAGFPNALCPLGSYVSADQAGLLQRYFERVIIMTDADQAGRKMGHTISAMLRGTAIEWAIWDWGTVYPDNAKDAGDMTEEQIATCIKNAVSDVAYKSFKHLA